MCLCNSSVVRGFSRVVVLPVVLAIKSVTKMSRFFSAQYIGKKRYYERLFGATEEITESNISIC